MLRTTGAVVSSLQDQILSNRHVGMVTDGVNKSIESVDRTVTSFRNLVFSITKSCVQLWLFSIIFIFTLITALCASWALATATSVGTYYFLVPRDTTVSIPFSFDYNASHPQSVLQVAGNLKDERLTALAYAFDEHTSYNFTVALDVPETQYNMMHQTFTVSVQINGLDEDGDEMELSMMSHSAWLHSPRAHLAHQVTELLLLPFHATAGRTAPMQHVELPMRATWRPVPRENITQVVIRISPAVHIYSSELIVSAQLSGVSGILQRWPVCASLVVFAAAFVATFNCTVICSFVLFGLLYYAYTMLVSQAADDEKQVYESPYTLHGRRAAGRHADPKQLRGGVAGVSPKPAPGDDRTDSNYLFGFLRSPPRENLGLAGSPESSASSALPGIGGGMFMGFAGGLTDLSSSSHQKQSTPPSASWPPQPATEWSEKGAAQSQNWGRGSAHSRPWGNWGFAQGTRDAAPRGCGQATAEGARKKRKSSSRSVASSPVLSLATESCTQTSGFRSPRSHDSRGLSSAAFGKPGQCAFDDASSNASSMFCTGNPSPFETTTPRGFSFRAPSAAAKEGGGRPPFGQKPQGLSSTLPWSPDGGFGGSVGSGRAGTEPGGRRQQNLAARKKKRRGEVEAFKTRAHDVTKQPADAQAAFTGSEAGYASAQDEEPAVEPRRHEPPQRFSSIPNCSSSDFQSPLDETDTSSKPQGPQLRNRRSRQANK
ncbi:hypothetical protein DIPPA_32329 [Diplonema papillatum]|nr:hypothetical protein DIPPA_32329 [Diplonema papillatum]